MKKYNKIIVFILCLIFSLSAGLTIWKLPNLDIPFVSFTKDGEWSIGIYMGDTPFTLDSPENISNPVLTAKDITDVSADFVADPFMVKEDSIWYMFFEVLNSRSNQGDIGLASSNDGLNWTYKQIVLDEPFHLSYPYVFKWKREYYMVPESHQANSIRLYKAVDFPTKWTFVRTLLDGNDYVDSSILRFDNKWWLFMTPRANGLMHLYYSSGLMGPWVEHPESPIMVGDGNMARPGGRIIIFNGGILRFVQYNDATFGKQVRAFEIDILKTTNYKEHKIDEIPILKASGFGWNADGMHHIDFHQIDKKSGIACVDGYYLGKWRLKIGRNAQKQR